MMDKKQLLELIQNLPDDTAVEPFDYSECRREEGLWESQGRSTEIGGVYRKTVDNELTLRLRFKTQFEGEFRRTYQNSEGQFFNLKRVRQ